MNRREQLYVSCGHGEMGAHQTYIKDWRGNIGAEGPVCSGGNIATSADLIAAVRRGVESGTIKGEVVTAHWSHGGRGGFCVRDLEPGDYLVIPVSDVGEDT